MAFKTSFTFRDSFRDVLSHAADVHNVSQTRLIEDAVASYGKTSTSESELAEKIETRCVKTEKLLTDLANQLAMLNTSMSGLDVLIKQVLKNQQEADKNNP